MILNPLKRERTDVSDTFFSTEGVVGASIGTPGTHQTFTQRFILGSVSHPAQSTYGAALPGGSPSRGTPFS